jgi:hypothetical protein
MPRSHSRSKARGADRGFELGRDLRPAALVALLAVAASSPARADEGGVGFWLPGQFGSLAAAPQVPGWSVGIVNVYESVSASGNVAAAREVTIGKLNPTAHVNLNLNLSANPDLVLVAPSYAFATPVFGGQFAVGMGAATGRSTGDLNGTLTVNVGPLTATRQGEISDARFGFSDLYPQTSLRWNSGVNSWMVYGTGDIPVGTYDSSRLANLGIGHGAVDGGAGYTYFDPKTGHEFSAVTGLTFNFSNPSTNYQNGIDWHVDLGASQFISKTTQVGVVGYFYQQLTADSGAPPFLGENLSRVAGVGPQIGFIFPAGSMQGYLNLKGYWEFAAENRASGWNAWVTLAFSPSPPTPTSASRRMLTK